MPGLAVTSAPAYLQNPYFTPNCMTRGVPAIDVIRPNAPELKFVCVLSAFINVGGPQLNVFNRLNVSTRSSTVRPVPNVTRRDNAASIDRKPGARTLLRRKFPSVPGAGSANAAGLSQCSGVFLSPYGFAST